VPGEDDELLTPKEVAALCRVHLMTVYHWLGSGTDKAAVLPSFKAGSRRRIRRADLEAFLTRERAAKE
jgi:excisionase family DNA binding protein